MKYLAFALRVAIIFLGLVMMYIAPGVITPPFISGVAILAIWIYFTLEWCYGEAFTKSIFVKAAPKVVKKKWFFSR